jgi:hypothetical protein
MHLSTTCIILRRTLDGIEVETVMLQESRIFARHYRHRHVRRNLIHRNPMMMQGNTLAISYLLKASNKHQRSDIHRNEPICHYSKNGGTEKQHHHPFYNILDFIQNHLFSFSLPGA